MKVKISIRRPKRDDAKILGEITHRAFKDDIPKYGEVPQELIATESHVAMMDEKGTEYYIATHENTIFGGIVIQNKGNDIFRLALIYVDYKYQRKGIGRLLYNYVEKKHKNIKKWLVETPSLNIENHKFYENIGFKKIGERKMSERMTAFLYEKNINDI